MFSNSPCFQEEGQDTLIIGAKGIGCDLVTQTDLEQTDEIPEKFIIYPNYPNPFNPATIISFSLPTKAEAEFKIYNINGQIIENRRLGYLTPGKYSFEWNPSESLNKPLPSGIYFYRIKAGNYMETRKMMLLK